MQQLKNQFELSYYNQPPGSTNWLSQKKETPSKVCGYVNSSYTNKG
jgi:hypothetical protein